MWTPRSVARVAKYSANDAGEVITTLAYVVHCLGFGEAVCCCSNSIQPIQVDVGGVDLRKAVRVLKVYQQLEPRFPGWVRRLLRPLTAIIAALIKALEALDKLQDVLDLRGECEQYQQDLGSLCTQLRILAASDLTQEEICDGPEFPGEAASNP